MEIFDNYYTEEGIFTLSFLFIQRNCMPSLVCGLCFCFHILVCAICPLDLRNNYPYVYVRHLSTDAGSEKFTRTDN